MRLVCRRCRCTREMPALLMVARHCFTVGNADHGGVRQFLQQQRVQHVFGFTIHGAAGFIEKYRIGPAQQDPHKRQPLLLAR